MKENYNGFPHNGATKDDDKESHTMYSYFVFFLYCFNGKMHAWKSSNNNQ